MLESCLTSRNLFQSNSLQETVSRCSQLLWPHRMNVVKRARHQMVNAFVSGVVGDELAMIYVKHGADVTIDAGEPDGYYLVQYNLSGQGKVSCGNRAAATSPESVTILSPDLHSEMFYDSETAQLGVRLKRRTVEQHLEDLLCAPLNKPLVFDLEMRPGSASVQSWKYTLQFLASQYDLQFENDISPDWDRAFAKMVIDLLLRLQPHNYSARLTGEGGRSDPAYVRRAQEYIHERLTESISMSDLSAAAGVTARTLQTSFRKYLGLAPMEYVRSVKMREIHKELLNADADASVSDIVMNYNIFNFGRFAQRYKERYGCLPSETLRRR